jgi:hypothetical protein
VLEPIIARWSDWAATGFEHLVLDQRPDAITADVSCYVVATNRSPPATT